MDMEYLKVLEAAAREGRHHLLEPEAYEVCAAFGIEYPTSRLVTSLEEGMKAITVIGFPLVMKIVSPQVIHKSDVGGVVTGIGSPGEFEAAYGRMLAEVGEKAAGAEIRGVLIQKAMSKGVELVVGGLRDPQFGPVVMFGSGGVLVEIIQDVSFSMAPLDIEEALSQIKETKVYKILKGVRGAKPCDLSAIADLIVKAGNLLAQVPAITELDFNPVLAYPDRCVAVDARIILTKK
jgi:acyl-CoA synthetase (NDP forming)